MSETQTQLPQPTRRGSNLSDSDYMWLLLVQLQSPRIDVDTTGGNVAIALPPAGLSSSTGQTAQNQELIYVKTSADVHTVMITGAASGTVTLTTQWQVARFKSNGTNWIQSN